MRRDTHPTAWMTWGGAVTLATVATRNPLYLSLLLLATSVVYLACVPRRADGTIWGLVIRIGLIVAVVSILFNLLTAHAGSDVLFRIPSGIPIAGGVVTANALLYGVSSALAILTLIVAAATFASVVDRAALLRALPEPLAPAGTAAIIGLSIFPQTLVSLREVREAQAARGFRVRSARDLAALVVPVLSLGLEGAFNLAEAMESRAFGTRATSQGSMPWLLPSGIVLTIAAISLLIEGMIVPAAALGAAGLLPVLFVLFGGRSERSSYRCTEWRRGELAVTAACIASALTVATSIIAFPDAIEWSPFSTLSLPTFAPWLGAACLLLLSPAIFSERPA